MRKLRYFLILALVLAPLSLTACKKTGSAENSYVIEGEYFPDEGVLKARETVTFFNDTDKAFSELKFQLWANAYREGAKYGVVSDIFYPAAYYDGTSYGGIKIESVEGGSYSVGGMDENILVVTPEKAVYPDEKITVTIAFETTLAKIAHRLGIGPSAVNLSGFYPVLCHIGDNGFEEYVYSAYGESFVSACANYSVSLTVPEGLTLVHGGTGREVTKNGKVTYNTVAENVRDVAFVLGSFECAKGNAGDTSVEYYYQTDEDPQTTLQAAIDSLTYFSETFTPYGREKYVVVETDFLHGGMEFPALSMISNDLRKEERAAVVAHETAHQWWYAKVGSNQFTEAWQDEGLAEYSTALFLDAYPAYGGSCREVVEGSEKAYRAFFSVYTQLGGANTKMSRPLTDYAGDYEYRSIAYDKGVILFDRVRNTVGDQKFFLALKKYASACNGKIATREDLLAAFERAGANAEGVILSFLDGLCVI